MKDLLTVTGRDALTLGTACHRQPEVWAGDHWRTVTALPEAARLIATDPSLVRLRAPTRVLVEDVLRTALQHGADVRGVIQDARRDILHPLDSQQLAALDIIEREIQ